MWDGETGGARGERSLLKKLRKTFMRGWIWVEFVQVRLRTNFAPSNAFGQVQMPQEIVLGRLRGQIRRLFDVGAVIRVENDVGFDQRATYSL